MPFTTHREIDNEKKKDEAMTEELVLVARIVPVQGPVANPASTGSALSSPRGAVDGAVAGDMGGCGEGRAGVMNLRTL